LQGILLPAILYFHPKSDKSVVTFLSLFIFCISIPILMPVGQQLFSWQVIIFVEPFTVAFGPLLYLYVRSFKETITWQKVWPHFVLFVLYTGLSFIVYSEVGAKYPPSPVVPVAVTQHPLSFIPVSIRLLQRLLYFFLSYRALTVYQRSIKQLFSETSRINLRWVRWLIYGYLVLVISTIICYSLILKYPENFSLWVLIIGVMVSAYIYVAVLKGITQPTLWQLQPVPKEKLEKDLQEAEKIPLPTVSPEKPRPVKAGMQPGKMDEIINGIHALMEKEKLYQETELTLQDLANKLNVPSYQVSQAINEGLNKSFYDLINNYRVEEAKRLLQDPQNENYTILSVGFEAGFNSKTTFNTVFKKFTGLTPTEFREKQKAGLMLSSQ
jgi:AraC-like DNA-binding protein